jgi:hypothetical protein
MAYRSGLSLSASRWIWNPYFGLYTFLPYRDVSWSPYGYGFYSPRAVYYVYNPPRVQAPAIDAFAGPRYNPTYGYATRGTTAGGGSGVVAASPSSPASSAGGEASVRGGSATSGGAARR